ncbi:phage portal protein [Zoogloea sp.]|uniref:phage portal protein n=1 Tax=Zoogloea sp. TaxID=49181 RepID=UPI001415D7B0|nr:MAG: phage portal protein [Zoogloea sp.]
MKRKNNKSRNQAATQAAPVAPDLSRSFVGAALNRLTADMGGSYSINQDIKQDLPQLRARSRDAALNNTYVRRFIELMHSNVVGPDGVSLSVQGLDITPRKGQQPEEVYDPISASIEKQFWRWAKPENCTVRGNFEWTKVQELVMEAVVTDGETLVWMRRGAGFGPFNFQLQLIEADHLDHNYNDTLPNGHRIVQGVEINEFARPVAYWIWKDIPADFGLTTGFASDRIRVDASELLHIYNPDRPSQVRGYPWVAPALLPLNHIDKFRDSVLVNARIASDRQVYFTQAAGATFTGQAPNSQVVEIRSGPGKQAILPTGIEVKQLDWQQPTTTFDDFQKSILRGVAAALGVSYNSLASDYESVSYSSARYAASQDQDYFKSCQKWFIQAFIRPVFEKWLETQMLTNGWGLNIGIDKFTKFSNVNYRPRAFGTVDPVKEVTSEIAALGAGLTSWTAEIEKRGGDPEAVFKQIAKDKKLMEEAGITPSLLLNQGLLQAQIAAESQNRPSNN